MESLYSIQQFGKLIGKSTKTLQKWDREGRLVAHRSPQSNRRYYTHGQYMEYRGLKTAEKELTVVYARVSGVAQKPDLANQINALKAYCDAQQIQVDAWFQDSGSGLNYKRKGFNQIMEQVELGVVRRIILAHRDRLVRFGYSYFEAFCERHHCEILVMNSETLSPEQEMVQDLIAITTVFSARLHGLRSYKRGIKNAALQKDQN